jgi:phage FluMu protein Com
MRVLLGQNFRAPTFCTGRTMPATRRNLRCAHCDRTLAYSGSDLFRYIRAGWPRCCEAAMSVEVEAPERVVRSLRPSQGENVDLAPAGASK